MPRPKAVVQPQRKPVVKVAAVATPVKVPATAVAPAATTTTPAVTAAVAPAATTKSVEPVVATEQRLQEMIDKLKDLKTMVNGICNDFITIATDSKREIKQLRRTQKKPRPANISGPKKPSTFVNPYCLSDELCAFLELPPKTTMSRNAVTHAIHKYCKAHGLLQDGDQRIIHPDDALRAILSPMPPDEQLTYFNLQRYLKHNYTAVAESASPVA